MFDRYHDAEGKPLPLKSEKRRVMYGPDSPDEALRWTQMFERDENGYLPPDGLMNARRQLDLMSVRQRAEEARLTGTGGALTSIAGISTGSWTWAGPGNIGGRTRAIAINPSDSNTIFAGSVAGGIWKTTDGGLNWDRVDDFMANLAISSIVFQPGNPSVMLASTGEGFSNQDAIRGAGIFRSTNGGASWTQLPNTAPTSLNQNFILVNELAFSPDGTILMAATSTGYWRSIDLGDNWSLRRALVNAQDVKFIPLSNSQVVAGGRTHNALYSSDGGVTWSDATIGTIGAANNRVELAVSPSQSEVVYASVAAGGTASTPPAEIWKSTDFGVTYTMVNNQASSLLGAQGWYDNAIWVDPVNASNVVVGGVGLFRSTDGGTTFSSMSTTGVGIHSDQHIIVQDPAYDGAGNRRVFIGNDGGLFKIDTFTFTGSPAATRLNNNYGVTQFYGGDGLLSNGKLYGGTQDNGTLLFTGNIQNWTAPAGSDGGMVTADQVNSILYGETQNLGVHRSLNGAGASTIVACGTAAPLADACNPTSSTTNFIAPLLLDPNNPDRLLAGGANLWLSTNPRSSPGTTVQWANIKLSTGNNISAIAVAKNNSDVIWIGHTLGALFTTSDGTSGAPTWTQRDGLPPSLGGTGIPNRTVASIAIDPTDSNTVYVSLGGFNQPGPDAPNIWVTHDNGANWSAASGFGGSQLPAAPVRWVSQHPTVAGWLYAGTDVGVFASEDAGATWKLPHDGPANVAVFQLFWMGNTLVAVTHGRGMYTTIVAPPSTPATIITHPQSQAVSMGATVTLSVVASGSTPFAYQWYQGASGNITIPMSGGIFSTFTPPAVFTPTSYWVRVTNAFGTADSLAATLTPQNGIATYDSTLKVPKCTVVASACDTGPSLILGRANIAGGAEPHQPNTINNSCPDGTTGTFHSTNGESIDSLKISNVAVGVPLSVGSTVKIDAGVWVNALTDRLDLYGTPNASSPVWTLITTITPGATGAQTLTTSIYVLPSGGLQAIRAQIRASGSAAPCSIGVFDDHDDLVFAVNPASSVEMIANGDFASGTAGWFQWEAPYMVSSVVSGVFQFLLSNPNQAASPRQATIFQNTNQPVVSGGPLLASFMLGNSGAARKRISVLVLEGDFSDIAVCTFWLPGGQTTLKPYTMKTHTTKGWTNASIYFYAATEGSTNGNYLVDNVSLKYVPAQATDRTECGDPNAPAVSAGAAAPNIVLNGDFSAGMNNWSAVAPITTQVTGGVLEFLRPNNNVPAGVVMQATGQTAVQDQIFTSTFSLGNSSGVRKRVTVLIHDVDLSNNPDLMACTFILPPGLALSNYSMQGRATKAWANATISFYPATVGLEQWIRLDNVTLIKNAPAAVATTTQGTDCVEPNTIAFPVPPPPGGGANGSRAGTTGSPARASQPAGQTGTPTPVRSDGPRLAGDDRFSSSGGGDWRVEAGSTRREVLRWAEPIDLTGTTWASLGMMSLFTTRASSAEIQVSLDGVTWETLAYVPPTIWWTGLDFDLSAYAGRTIYLQFVFDAVAPDAGVAPDAWRFYDASITMRGGRGGG